MLSPSTSTGRDTWLPTGPGLCSGLPWADGTTEAALVEELAQRYSLQPARVADLRAVLVAWRQSQLLEPLRSALRSAP